MFFYICYSTLFDFITNFDKHYCLELISVTFVGYLIDYKSFCFGSMIWPKIRLIFRSCYAIPCQLWVWLHPLNTSAAILHLKIATLQPIACYFSNWISALFAYKTAGLRRSWLISLWSLNSINSSCWASLSSSSHACFGASRWLLPSSSNRDRCLLLWGCWTCNWAVQCR